MVRADESSTVVKIEERVRPLYFAAGILFVALGVVGAFLPVMPTTIFLILAAGCFGKSSPGMERWICEHPRLGPPVVAWQRERSIRLRHKVVAIVLIWVSTLASVTFAGLPLPLDGALLAIAVALTAYLLTRPTKVDAKVDQPSVFVRGANVRGPAKELRSSK